MYLADTCIGDVLANSPDEAYVVYARRTKTATYGLTAILVMQKTHAFYDLYILMGHDLFVRWLMRPESMNYLREFTDSRVVGQR